MSEPSPLAEYGAQAYGHAIQTCGPHTGHFVKNVAFCDGGETAAFLAKAITARASILSLLGNVDHSTDSGPNGAKLRGQMLEDIRAILAV